MTPETVALWLVAIVLAAGMVADALLRDPGETTWTIGHGRWEGSSQAPLVAPCRSQGVVSFCPRTSASWTRMRLVRFIAMGWRPPGPE